LLAIASGVWFSIHNFQQSNKALSDIKERNAKVAAIVKKEHVNALIGDYWRVLPIKQQAHGSFNIVPMQTCSQERDTLTSRRWDRSHQHGRQAYLLTIDGSMTDFPDCTFAALENIYGTPESSALIAGTLDRPKELLLVYGTPTESKKTVSPQVQPAAALSLTLPNSQCSGPAVVNIVAHEDDDLLFMNPDTARAIRQGFCVRTVYLTAGDAGIGTNYWLAREHGSREAYSRMTGEADKWNLQEVTISTNSTITIATPENNKRISLLFLRLPDGNLRGQGFNQTGDQSLGALYTRRIDRLYSVDKQASYSNDELAKTLAGILTAYQPSLVRTQSSVNSSAYEDHSDHQTTGKLATEAYRMYEKSSQQKSKIAYYIGYPVRDKKANLSHREYAEKADTFLAYAKYDPSVCASLAICAQTPTYYGYLYRQYETTR
jgi:LmbE family N-acetylglucosaminyl deacetylase